MKEKITAIILAGGMGKRMAAKVPKQFLPLRRKPILLYSIECFEQNPLISDIIVVCRKEYLNKTEKIIIKANIKKIFKVVPGGKTRQESSFIGIKNAPSGTAFALIHDAARPFIDNTIISDVLKAAKKSGASCPVIDTEDTIVIQKNNLIESIPDRRNLKRVQTPQGFCYKTIYNAHEWAKKKEIKNATDDCYLIKTRGRKVQLVKGSIHNIKITTQADLA